MPWSPGWFAACFMIRCRRPLVARGGHEFGGRIFLPPRARDATFLYSLQLPTPRPPPPPLPQKPPPPPPLLQTPTVPSQKILQKWAVALRSVVVRAVLKETSVF